MDKFEEPPGRHRVLAKQTLNAVRVKELLELLWICFDFLENVCEALCIDDSTQNLIREDARTLRILILS